MLIGRTEQQKTLKRAYESEESQLVAVYGRRRVGKTYLIRETFKNKFTFYHTGLNHATRKEQLLAWRQSLEQYGYTCKQTPKDWAEAFGLLKKLVSSSSEKKKVIFIDEMPWMDTPGSNFVTWLESFWNGWGSSRNDVMMIICGSAASWIIKKVFRNRGGLHNRVTCRIFVKPFTLHECQQFTDSKKYHISQYDILEAYMIMGGIPYYWTLLDTTRSITDNIGQIILLARRSASL